MATGLGGYVHLGGNIANIVTLGIAASADDGLNSKEPVLLTTLGPEVQVFPLRLLGVYGGCGWSFRNTDLPGQTRSDDGHFVRAGLVGEIPLTTRLAFQMRAGVVEHFFLPGDTRLTGEGQIGLAIY
jgi:hypothetical protein